MTLRLLLCALLFTAFAHAQVHEAEKKAADEAAKSLERKIGELEQWLKEAWGKPASEAHVKPAAGIEKKEIRVREEKKPVEEKPEIQDRIERCTSAVLFKAPFNAAARAGLGTAIDAYGRGDSESQIVSAAETAAIERFKKEVNTTLHAPETRAAEVLQCVLNNGVGEPVRDAFKSCAKTAFVTGQTSAQAVHCFSAALLK